MNRVREKVCLLLAVVILGGMLEFSLLSLRTQIPAADEMIFIRITQQLPKYDSHMVWYSIDGKTDPNTYLEPSPFFDKAYNHPIWVHPPAANYLAYPIVKLLYHESSEVDIREGVLRLRWIAWAMIAFCILGAVYLVRKRDRSGKVFLLSMLPLATGYILFTQWGDNWFYHDTFMLAFLMVALLMRKTKYEKFIYIPLALMVGSKIYGVLFLIPFTIENRKTVLCSLALVPYFVQSYFVTGNFFYPIAHWLAMGSFTAGYWGSEFLYSGVLGQLRAVAENASNIILFLVIIAAPFVYITYKAIKKEISWFLPTLFAISLVIGLGWTSCYYQMLPMLVVGVLVAGEAAIQLKAKKEVSNVSLLSRREMSTLQ